MYTLLVPDRRIRALIKSKLDERNKDQYVDSINGQDQNHRIHRWSRRELLLLADIDRVWLKA